MLEVTANYAYYYQDLRRCASVRSEPHRPNPRPLTPWSSLVIILYHIVAQLSTTW